MIEYNEVNLGICVILKDNVIGICQYPDGTVGLLANTSLKYLK